MALFLFCGDLVGLALVTLVYGMLPPLPQLGRAEVKLLNDLFTNNREWAERIKAEDPNFFATLSAQQAPEYLWIGCSDSRVPANQLMGLLPGDVFVHRNVANLVVHTDFNCLSVLQYAVEVLKVKHIIVCGHYGCGGVKAAMQNQELGLIDNWLRNIKDVYFKYGEQLEAIEDEHERFDYLCELNVAEQVANVCHTTIIQNAWRKGQELAVHGWIYGIKDGLLHDLDLCISGPDQIPDVYRAWPDMRPPHRRR